MNLQVLQRLVMAATSLEDIEKDHPAPVGQIAGFVKEIQNYCDKAYGAYSKCLSEVIALAAEASVEDVRSIARKFEKISSLEWHRELSHDCRRLKVLIWELGIQRGLSFEDRDVTTEDIQRYNEVVDRRNRDRKMLKIAHFLDDLDRGPSGLIDVIEVET